MNYKRHMAYEKNGDYSEAYLCMCPRVQDHPIPRAVPAPADLELFAFNSDGEMAI